MFDDFIPYESPENAGVRLPKISVSKEELATIDSKLTESSSSFDILKALVRKGILEKGINKWPNRQDYYDRAKQELDTFEELGFTDYVLLNWDIIGFCHKNKIPVAAGRGSAPSSMVLYLLKVTNIDPIPNGLFFERFVSKSRAKKVYSKSGQEFLVGDLLPDVDSDISYDQRQKVISYIEEKHKGKTSKILTFNTFSSKLCIREAAKYFCEYNESEASAISDLIPKLHGIVEDLDKAYNDVPRFKEWADQNPLAYKNALKIVDLNKNTGCHPSGIAICAELIDDIIPLQKTKEGELISGYDMKGVADLMVKFDILGLRTLTVAHRTCERLGLKLDEIDETDPFIYQCYQDFKNPMGLFQISADVNFKCCQQIKPLNLEELADVVAIARPASLQFVSDYVEQKKNPTPIGLHPKLDEILGASKNVMLFQESLMKTASEVFGMSLEDAEILRRVVGKKLVDQVAAWKEKIYQAAREKELEEKVADYFWNVVEAAAAYGFNRSHAFSAANLAAKTTYLKWKYPQQFFISLLESAEFEPEPLAEISAISKELCDFGIRLLPPSLEKSDMTFSIEGSDIRYGLSTIKGVSSKALEALVDFRGKKFANKYEIFVAAKVAGINISVLAALIQAGTMDSSGHDRSRMVLEAQAFNLLTDREKRNFAKGGERFGYDLLNTIAEVVEKKILGDDNKPIISEKRFVTFKKDFAKYRAIYSQNRKHDKFAKWYYETSLLGYSYSHELKDCFTDHFGVLHDLKEIADLPDRGEFKVAGQVDDFYTKTSAAGNKYMSVTVSDNKAIQKFLLMDNRRAANLTNFLDSKKLAKKDIIIINGSKSGDTFFVENIDIVDCSIYLKAGDVKKTKDD